MEVLLGKHYMLREKACDNCIETDCSLRRLEMHYSELEEHYENKETE